MQKAEMTGEEIDAWVKTRRNGEHLFPHLQDEKMIQGIDYFYKPIKTWIEGDTVFTLSDRVPVNFKVLNE